MPIAGATHRPQWSIGDRLRKAREDAALDQRELAERAGISRATVSNAERGVGTPNTATLRVWAAATGVSLAWLVDDEATQPITLPQLQQLLEGDTP
jgi:transcriptional regulator with XRE-family HTH domain